MTEANAISEVLGALIAFIFFISYKDRSFKNKSDMIFRQLMFCMVMSFLVDAATWLTVGYPSMLWMLKSLWIPDYLCIVTTAYMYHLYIVQYISEKTDISRMLVWLISPLPTVGIITWIISMWTGLYYTFDNNGLFHYTNYHWFSQFCVASIVIIDVMILFKYRKVLGKKQTLVLMLYGGLPVLVAPLGELLGSSVFIYLAMLVSLVIVFEEVVSKQSKDIMKKELEIREINTKLMLSQIKPHFLYNTITSIMVLCQQDGELASDALADFADYLRANLHSIDSNTLIPFWEEMNHIETYLRLEKIRFGERLNVIYDIKEEDFFVPTLTIQTLVENAVKHGVTKKVEGGTINIKSYSHNGKIYVEIKDDGVGFDYSKFMLEERSEDSEKHIGIKNVKRRLGLIGKGILTVESEVGVGTTAKICFVERITKP